MAKAVAKQTVQPVITERARKALAIEFAALPETLEGKIDAKGWLTSLVAGVPYVEPDPDLISREMLLNIMLTEDLGTALTGADMLGLQDVVEDFAGSSTGPIRILDLYVLQSNLEDKDGTYLIIEWLSMEDGHTTRCSTGAGAIQMSFLRFLAQGIWPIECQIVRDKATDQGGRHILKVWPVDGR